MARRAVDHYELAAALESDGLTDSTASRLYGHSDVFELADELRRRAQDADIEPGGPAEEEPLGSALRDIAHGLLYLLPAVIFPIGLVLLQRDVLLPGILVVGMVGWVWSGVVAWSAYRFVGRGHPGSAARLLRWSVPGGILVAVAASGAVVIATGATAGLLAIGAAQMGFQSASGLLMFYRREGLLFAAMAPATLAGIVYLVVGSGVEPVALTVVSASLVTALVLALLQTRDRDEGVEPSLAAGLRRDVRDLPPVFLYIVFSAAFLLHAQSQFLLNRFDVLVAFLPLFLGMGVVEWRARRFVEQARALMEEVRHPSEYVRRVWVLLAANAGTCVVAVAVLSALVIAFLHHQEMLTPAAVVLSVAGALLAAAYFVGFLLANLGLHGWLAGSLALCTVVQIGAMSAGRRPSGALVETWILLGCALLLLVLYTAALAGRLSKVRTFR